MEDFGSTISLNRESPQIFPWHLNPRWLMRYLGLCRFCPEKKAKNGGKRFGLR